jgi:hypothetical protein
MGDSADEPESKNPGLRVFVKRNMEQIEWLS